MTECRLGCGQCCVVIMLPFTKRDLSMMLPADQATVMEADGIRWVKNDLTEISRKEAKQRAPWYFRSDIWQRGVPMQPYLCRFYDEETTLCTAHDQRPNVCKRYPQGDDWPRAGVFLPPACEFRKDIGQPIELGPRR